VGPWRGLGQNESVCDGLNRLAEEI